MRFVRSIFLKNSSLPNGVQNTFRGISRYPDWNNGHKNRYNDVLKVNKSIFVKKRKLFHMSKNVLYSLFQGQRAKLKFSYKSIYKPCKKFVFNRLQNRQEPIFGYFYFLEEFSFSSIPPCTILKTYFAQVPAA